MNAILALAAKDLKIMLRDKAGFFFVFFFPLLMAVFFGAIFSGSGSSGGMSAITLLVVDEDNSEQSRKFHEAISASDELNVEITDKEDAYQRVRLGQSVAYVVLKEGFGEARERMFWGDPPKIELGVDPARGAEGGLIQGMLTKYAAEGMWELFTDGNIVRKQIGMQLDELRSPTSTPFIGRDTLIMFLEALDRLMASEVLMTDEEEGGGESEGGGNDGFQGFQFLEFETADVIREQVGPQSSYEISFPQGIIWGMIACAAAFGISLVVERTHGTLVRLQTAPISEMQILAGKAVACFTTTAFVCFVLLLIAKLIFGVQPSSLPKLVLAVFSVSIGFVGIMMFLSVLGKTEQSAGGIGWAVLMVMAMSGGGMIPLFAMPPWMQQVANFSPVKWSVLALEGAIWRDFTYAEMMWPCGILLAVGVIFFAIGVRAFSWTQQD